MAARLQVELLVCPTCRQVGKVPNQSQNLRGYCTGNLLEGTGHPKKRMVSVAFEGKLPQAAPELGAVA